MAPIAALAEVTLGKMLQPAAKSAEDVRRPYLRAAHVQPHGQLALEVEAKEMWFSPAEAGALDLRKGDVLVVEGGAVGRSTCLGDDLPCLGFQNSLIRLRPTHASDGRFLDYALRSALAAGAIDVECSTVSMAHFTTEKVSRFRIPAPNIETQRRIADYLDRETAEIDAMDAELDWLMETLRERRMSAHEAALEAAFSVDGSLQPMWSVLRPVKDQGHPDEEVLSVFREYGVIPKSSRIDDNHNRTPENLSSYQLVRPGDVVINKMKAWQGSLGVSAHRGIVSPDYQVCRPAGPHVDPSYLHLVLRSPRMIPQYRVRSKGIRPSQWRLYWEDMAPLGIPVPPLDKQRHIAAELDAQTARIDDMIADAQRLKELLVERRSTLITEVVTGRKEVPA
ncbi:restriction endonuclease subunit S [Tessaracoccus massiliensis]|uniref:restriction endonuclease subunit S n=1 Tax=Tessaracoccus massiliensis TaxID=1522311 RepID=UPI0006934187|nr:restriction endonuclease subunit S [Tessaracoccus massiliensis]